MATLSAVPFDAEGHIDPALWRKYRADRRGRRVWQGEEDEVDCLAHKTGGAEFARWVFDYNDAQDNVGEAGDMFSAHRFSPYEYVSISGHDRKLRSFRRDAGDAVLLSMGNSCALELKL